MIRPRPRARWILTIELALLGLAVVACLAGGIELLATARATSFGLTGKDHADAVNDTRTAIIHLLGGFGVVASLAFTARTYSVNRRQQQVAHLFGAIERVGISQTAPARAAALVELWSIARDRGGRYRDMADRVLAGVVVESKPDRGRVAVDVATALSLLAERPRDWVDATPILDLRGANLPGVDLSGPLRNVRFDSCCLYGAHLVDAVLPGATFSGACLDGATLAGAHLPGARFEHASLRNVTNVVGADLSGIVLTGADTTGSPELEAIRRQSPSRDPLALPHDLPPRPCTHPVRNGLSGAAGGAPPSATRREKGRLHDAAALFRAWREGHRARPPGS